MDHSGDTPVRVFESGAILMHLAEKFDMFMPKRGAARAECLSWLFWQMGSAPYLGGGFGENRILYRPLCDGGETSIRCLGPTSRG